MVAIVGLTNFFNVSLNVETAVKTDTMAIRAAREANAGGASATATLKSATRARGSV